MALLLVHRLNTAPEREGKHRSCREHPATGGRATENKTPECVTEATPRRAKHLSALARRVVVDGKGPGSGMESKSGSPGLRPPRAWDRGQEGDMASGAYVPYHPVSLPKLTAHRMKSQAVKESFSISLEARAQKGEESVGLGWCSRQRNSDGLRLKRAKHDAEPQRILQSLQHMHVPHQGTRCRCTGEAKLQRPSSCQVLRWLHKAGHLLAQLCEVLSLKATPVLTSGSALQKSVAQPDLLEDA
ncbi:hypothetical protein Efla_002134 [Eimeria flavescens]